MKMKGITVLVVTLTLLPMGVLAETPPPPVQDPMMGQGMGSMMGGNTNGPEHHQEMMAHHEQMAKQIEEMNQKLDKLVTKMNTAEGSEKISAMAAVINELVAERRQMNEQFLTMHQHWMNEKKGRYIFVSDDAG